MNRYYYRDYSMDNLTRSDGFARYHQDPINDFIRPDGFVRHNHRIIEPYHHLIREPPRQLGTYSYIHTTPWDQNSTVILGGSHHTINNTSRNSVTIGSSYTTQTPTQTPTQTRSALVDSIRPVTDINPITGNSLASSNRRTASIRPTRPQPQNREHHSNVEQPSVEQSSIEQQNTEQQNIEQSQPSEEQIAQEQSFQQQNIEPPQRNYSSSILPALIPEDSVEQTEGQLTCTVCSEKRVTVVINPCGHAKVCLACLHEWEINQRQSSVQCPICRTNIAGVIRLFIE